jgi:hypothetical protein
MIYTNDEADKQTRQVNFYVTVYLIPIALAAAICALVYWGSANNYVQKKEVNVGYMLSFTPAAILYAFNRKNWLKMPDGTYHNITGISPTPKLSVNEPATYDAVFFYTKTDNVAAAFMGLAGIGLGIGLCFKNLHVIIVPIVLIINGLFFAYVGLKRFLNKEPGLKIAKNGLWTRKLGFVNWDDINYAEVVLDKSGRTPVLCLEIRLKGTKFEEANKPDQRLMLSQMKDNEMIELVINSTIDNYNKQKMQHHG